MPPRSTRLRSAVDDGTVTALSRPLLSMNFDLRHPPQFPTSGAELYRAALDMCTWADERGFDRIAFGEHHQAADGYIPTPLLMAAAVVACTRQARVRISVLLATLYDPVRLAEEIAVADLCLGGRLDVGLGVGYVEHDFAMFGRDFHRVGFQRRNLHFGCSLLFQRRDRFFHLSSVGRCRRIV